MIRHGTAALRTHASFTRLVVSLIALLFLLPAIEASAAAPRIWGAPDTAAAVGTRYSFTPTARDADRRDRLRFFISNKPVWASFDSRTGRLIGTPGSRHVGTYSGITIGVTDGRNRVTLPRFSITVRRGGSTPPPTENPPPAENAAPIITGTPPPQGVQGQPYAFTPTASDPNGDSLTFSIANKPAWASFSTSTGRLSGTPGPGDVGNYGNIRISVSDGRLSASLASFSIAVVGVASGSATLTWQPPTNRTDGSALTNLAGYKVLWGTSRGNYSSSVQLTNAGITRYVVENLAPATYYFVVVAVDANGLESNPSNEASKTIR